MTPKQKDDYLDAIQAQLDILWRQVRELQDECAVVSYVKAVENDVAEAFRRIELLEHECAAVSYVKAVDNDVKAVEVRVAILESTQQATANEHPVIVLTDDEIRTFETIRAALGAKGLVFKIEKAS